MLEQESGHTFLNRVEQLSDSECTENTEEEKSWLRQICLWP